MAERRMFSKQIIDSDAFLEMPLSSQALYFHLSMRADDDGFVNNPNKIARVIGSNKNDLDILVAKRFILTFDSGVIVIKHWRINNYLQSDRIKPTIYQEEMYSLDIKDNKSYTEKTPCIQTVSKPYTQCSVVKNSIDKNSIDYKECESTNTSHTRKAEPTLEEVNQFFKEIDAVTDGTKFFFHYQSAGWKIKGSPIEDWKAKAKLWNLGDIAKLSVTDKPKYEYAKSKLPDVEIPWLDEYIKNLK